MEGKEAFEYLKGLGEEKGMAELNRVSELFFNMNKDAMKTVQGKLDELTETDKVLFRFGMDVGLIALLGSYGDEGFMALGLKDGLKHRLRNILRGMIHEKGMDVSELHDMIDAISKEKKPDYEEEQ